MQEFHKFLEEMLVFNLEESVNDAVISEKTTELSHSNEDLDATENILEFKKDEQGKSLECIPEDKESMLIYSWTFLIGLVYDNHKALFSNRACSYY